MKKFTLFLTAFLLAGILPVISQSLDYGPFAKSGILFHTDNLKQKNHLVGDTVWVNDSSISYNVEDDVYTPVLKIISLNFDQEGNRTGYLWFRYDTVNNLWKLNYHDSVAYYENGKFKESFGFRWDDNLQLWKMENYKFVSEDEKTVKEIHQTWSTSSGKYFFGMSLEKKYTENGLITEEFHQKLDTNTQSWVNNDKTEYFYDENGRDTLHLYYLWNPDKGDWELTSKTVFTFDPQQNLEVMTGYEWEKDAGTWRNGYRFNTYFNNNDMKDSTISQTWQSYYQFWNNSTKTIFYYDDQGRFVNKITQTWYPGEEKWYNQRNYFVQYENDIMVSQGEKLWDLTAKRWDNHRRYLYEYQDGLLYSYAYQQAGFETHEYVDVARAYYTYDRNGNLIKSQWGSPDENGEWQLNHESDYYWSPLSSHNSIPEINTETLNIYPNPAKDMVWINYPLENGNSATLKVIDLNGRAVLTKEISGKLTGLPVGTLSKGIYTVQIETEGKQINGKLLIR